MTAGYVFLFWDNKPVPFDARESLEIDPEKLQLIRMWLCMAQTALARPDAGMDMYRRYYSAQSLLVEVPFDGSFSRLPSSLSWLHSGLKVQIDCSVYEACAVLCQCKHGVH